MLTIATRAELEYLLADDVPHGDLTTDTLGIGATLGEMTFTARDAMTLALAEDAAAIIELAGCRVRAFRFLGGHARTWCTYLGGDRSGGGAVS